MAKRIIDLLLLFLLFDKLYGTRPECPPTVTSTCQPEGQRIQPTQKCLGDQLRIFCPPYHDCDGDYIIFHSAHLDGEFEVIGRHQHTVVNITRFRDGGVYRCNKTCFNGTVSPSCSLRVEGESWNFSVLNIARIKLFYVPMCYSLSFM